MNFRSVIRDASINLQHLARRRCDISRMRGSISGERGANLVEAALIIPLLALILVGVIDMGRAYHAHITIINAAREGARYGVSHAVDTSGIRARVLAEAELSDVDLSGASVTVANSGSGGSIRVTVQTSVPIILGGIVGQPTLPIRYSVAFRVR